VFRGSVLDQIEKRLIELSFFFHHRFLIEIVIACKTSS